MPPAYEEGESGPRVVKCHSKRLSSRGSTWRLGEALEASSEASFSVRLIVGFLVLNCPRVDMVAVCERASEHDMRRKSNSRMKPQT